MKEWAVVQQRYQQDQPAIRLGGLASNLHRLAWCAQRANHEAAIALFRESKFFTEWAAPDCRFDQQVLLAELQLRLALWERGWGGRLTLAAIAEEAQHWATKLLKVAGLVTE